MLKTLKSNKAFTLVEVIAVLVVLGILAVYASSKFNTGNVDNVVDESVIKDVVRQTQMRAMADIPGAGWKISINGSTGTCLIQKNNITKQTYTIKTNPGSFVISFDNMGQPAVSIASGSLPFTIDPVTGYVE